MIYAIVMTGGRGTRLKTPVEKPLFKLQNKPLIKYVLDKYKWLEEDKMKLTNAKKELKEKCHLGDD